MVHVNPSGAQRRFNTTKSLDIPIRCVCAKCNNTWMSDIEATAKPIITAMMRNERTTLHPEDQQAVATWACLKTIIGRLWYVPHDETPFIRRDWVDYLFTNHKPPPNWLVLIGRYDGERPQWAMTHHFPLLRNNETGVLTETAATGNEAVALTLVVGYFAMKVLGLNKSRATFPGYDDLLRMWPQTSPLSLIWPPKNTIRDGVSWQRFEQLFFDTGLTPIP